MPSSEERFQRAWMLGSNATMMISWARVLRTFYRHHDELLWGDPELSTLCEATLVPDLRLALVVSFLEFFNSMVGLTKSNPKSVLLFAVVRAGVEMLAAPMLPSCRQWQHLYTTFIWSLGDTVRFGCFVLDIMVPNARLAKSIRYTVGPVLFPFGAFGEVLMLVEVARYRSWYWLYLLAALWPLGFVPLMKQLLKNRRKFFAAAGRGGEKGEKAKVKSV